MADPRQLVARFYDEVVNDKRLEALDELVAPHFVEHGTPPISGIEAFRGFLGGLAAGFPDIRLTVDDWIVAGDQVVARCSVRGTHRGEFLGYAPTGKPVSWTSIHIWRLEGERLAERWSEADLLGITEQLQAP